MNGRQNLYRLQHWLLAERQRYLGDLETLAARLRADVENLAREINEAGSSRASAELKAVYPMFVGPLVERRQAGAHDHGNRSPDRRSARCGRHIAARGQGVRGVGRLSRFRLRGPTHQTVSAERLAPRRLIEAINRSRTSR